MASKRFLSLAAVCLQSTVLAIVIHVSQAKSSSGPSYKASSAVLLTEIGKLVLSLGLAYRDTYNSSQQHGSEAVTEEKAGNDDHVIPMEDQISPRTDSFSRSSIDSEAHLLPQASSRSSSSSQSFSTLLFDNLKSLRAQIFCAKWWHMAFPAFLFLIQNNLIYVAARNLSVPVFQITFQLKTLITAVCAVVMLNRKLSKIQWIALSALGLGVALIQLSANSSQKGDQLVQVRMGQHQLLGFIAVVLSCFSSAIAATYFELVLKRVDVASIEVDQNQVVRSSSRTNWPTNSNPNSPKRRISRLESSVAPTLKISQKQPTVWVRNIQLSFFSCLLGIFVVAMETYARDGVSISNWASSLQVNLSTAQFFAPVHAVFGSFFEGFSSLTWVVISIQAIGGLLIALVIKYADNVAKGFALSASVVLTVLLCIIFFNYRLTWSVVIGTLVVLSSTIAFEHHTSIAIRIQRRNISNNLATPIMEEKSFIR